MFNFGNKVHVVWGFRIPSPLQRSAMSIAHNTPKFPRSSGAQCDASQNPENPDSDKGKTMNNPLKGFITYSHKDDRKRKRLRTCLAVMEEAGEIDLKDDTDITAGGEACQEDILKEVTGADILLYLVSVNSLASENCNKELIEAVRAGRTIISIILESCDWLKHQLSDFAVLPHKGKPINKWKPQSDGWQNVVDGIRNTVKEMQAQVDAPSRTPEEELRAELAFQHGNVLMMIKQMDMAIERYSYAIELNPDLADAYNNRGVVYDIKGEYNRAITDYNKAIALKPDFTVAYSNRGGAYNNKSEYDRAIADCNKAMELNPHYAYAYNNRGLAYVGKDDYSRAIEDFNTTIQLERNDVVAYNNRGNVYSNIGDYDRAIEDFNTAIQLKRNDADSYNNRGAAYRKKGDNHRAIGDYTKAIALDPDHAIAYTNRGMIYREKGEVDRAIEDFTKVIELKPDLVEAYCYRGMAYAVKRDFDRAIADFTKVIQFKPDFAEAYCYRGMVWFHLGEWEKAKTDLMTARDMGIDIIAAFHYFHESVADFEAKHGVRLPADIAEMLTPPQA